MKLRIEKMNRLLGSLGVLLLATACGNMNSNPTEEYTDVVSESVPLVEKKVHVQEYLQEDFFKLETSGILNFVQGREQRYYIKPRLLMTGVEYTLEAGDGPEGVSLVPATDDLHLGQYVLTWAPKMGLLADQENIRLFKFEVKIKVTGTADARSAEIMNLISHPRELELKVVRSDDQVLIEKVELPKDTINEGESLVFSVIVKDLGASAKKSPRLAAFDENNETNSEQKLEAGSYVRIAQKPKDLGDGRFRFTGVLNLEGVKLPGKVPVVPARFVLLIAGVASADHVVEVKVKRRSSGGAL